MIIIFLIVEFYEGLIKVVIVFVKGKKLFDKCEMIKECDIKCE